MIQPPQTHIHPSLTAERLLELSTDGRICETARARARALDAAAPRTQARIRVGRIHMKPRTVVDLMAAAIVAGWARCAQVTEDDFARLGLTRTQVARHRDAAWSAALAQEPRVADMGRAA